METILFFAAVLVILLVQYWRGENRRRKARMQRLIAQWGQVPDREYGDGDIKRIARYYEMTKREFSHPVDDITWNDLGMDEIYMLCNHTQSSIGEEYLYRLLRTPVSQEEIVTERSRVADCFADDENLRLELEKQLSRIGKNGRLALCDYLENLGEQPVRSNWIHNLGILGMAAALVLCVIRPYWGGLLLIGAVAFQIITYYQQKAKIESYFISVSKVVCLSVCSQDIVKLLPEELAVYRDSLRQSVKALEPIRKKSGWIAMGQTMGGSPLDLLADYLKMLLHTDLIAYNRIVAEAKKKKEEIWNAYEILGQLECGLAIASFRQCLGIWCRPVFGQRKPLGCEEAESRCYLYGEALYHPLIDQAVPNTIHADRCQLITGSNASGKSTFLKTVALSALLAQTVDTVPGASYQAPFYQIYSSMALTDNLIGGESYYMVEIRSLKRILDRGEDELPVLCFVDEVLRGTNTVERIAASAQILKSMAQMNLLCFAATHDGELTYLLEPWYENGHFREEIQEGDIVFSYHLYPGRSGSRNALKLLGLMGYEQQVLDQAQKMAEEFMETGIWRMTYES